MTSSFVDRPSFRRRLCAFALAVVALSGMDAIVARDAHAGRRFGGGPRAMNVPGGRAQQQRAMQRQAQPQAPRPTEAPPVPARNITPVEAPQEGGRPGRLSPDERRALRQQINDAGRDLYRPSRP